MSPHRQGRPWAEGILLCPISPAAPSAPRSSCPPVTIPTPMPVEAFTKSRSRWRSRCPRRSESAITLASLSTKTGAPEPLVSFFRYGASSTPSQPAMIGESRLAPRSRSTVPGMLRPTARTSFVRRPASLSRSANPAATWGIRSSGAAPTSWSSSVVASTPPSRSQTPSWVRLRPIAPASTTPASWLNRSPTGGRPPVEGTRSVSSESTPSTTRPDSSSAPTRAATAVRDRPVTRPRSLRVRARPSRIREKTSPAVAGPGTDDMGAIEPLIRPRVHTTDALLFFKSHNYALHEHISPPTVEARSPSSFERAPDVHLHRTSLPSLPHSRPRSCCRLRRLRRHRRPGRPQAAARPLPARPRRPADRRDPDRGAVACRARRRRLPRQDPRRAAALRAPRGAGRVDPRPLRRAPDPRQHRHRARRRLVEPRRDPRRPRTRARLLPRDRTRTVRSGRPTSRRPRPGHDRLAPGAGEADRHRPGLRAGDQRRRRRRSSRRTRSSGSTTTSARRASRTCWSRASPTASSSRSGTRTASTTCRSPPRSRSASAPAAATTTGPARCAT